MVIDTVGIEQVLLSAHAMLAAYTGIDDFELKTPEAGALAQGIAGVARYYPAIAMPPQVAAWVALVAIVSKVYGPRVGPIRAKFREKRRPANVVQTSY